MLETAFGSLYSLVDEGALALPILIERLTSGPAKILGRKLGSLRRGWPADVVLIDPKSEWIVEPDEFASLSRNTPLAGVRAARTRSHHDIHGPGRSRPARWTCVLMIQFRHKFFAPSDAGTGNSKYERTAN